MKYFKDVMGDVNSLPLMMGIPGAAKLCSLLTLLPLIPLIYVIMKYPYFALAAAIYAVLIADCIEILLDNPVKEGKRLKDRMILALTVPNCFILLVKMIICL